MKLEHYCPLLDCEAEDFLCENCSPENKRYCELSMAAIRKGFELLEKGHIVEVLIPIDLEWTVFVKDHTTGELHKFWIESKSKK